MKTLLYKQLRLVCQPMTLVFCLFGVMLLIPAYPYTVMWFYVMLWLFFSPSPSPCCGRSWGSGTIPWASMPM